MLTGIFSRLYNNVDRHIRLNYNKKLKFNLKFNLKIIKQKYWKQ